MAIDKIGIEIETAIDNDDYNGFKKFANENGLNLHSDGSINCSSFSTPIEIVSIPFKYSDIDNLKGVMVDTSEWISEINRSMGFHIHLSFTDYSDYCKLLSYEFVDYFAKEYTNRFKSLREKARAKNHYCEFYKNEADFKKFTFGQIISKGKCGDRYKAVNFNAYNVHKTVEFRIFPMNNVDKLKDYLDFTIEKVNFWLSNTKNKSISAKIQKNFKNKAEKVSIKEKIVMGESD